MKLDPKSVETDGKTLWISRTIGFLLFHTTAWCSLLGLWAEAYETSQTASNTVRAGFSGKGMDNGPNIF